MTAPTSIALRTFNERVRTMNQTGGKQLVLSAQEARSLQGDLFNLLAMLAELNKPVNSEQDTSTILASVDGGGF